MLVIDKWAGDAGSFRQGIIVASTLFTFTVRYLLEYRSGSTVTPLPLLGNNQSDDRKNSTTYFFCPAGPG